jgi:drug/metabolite transporter (DMT)-like permease
MGAFLVVWLLSALAVMAIVYLVKSLRRRRPAGLGNFHWPGLIVIALIVGAFPAYFYYNQLSRSVLVPDGVAERPKIPDPGKN